MAPSNLAVALLGLGRWGRNIARVLQKGADFDLVAVCDPDPVARSSVPGVPGFADVGSLLLGERLEAVLIATPPATHAGLAIQCLRAGPHVFVEKPLALATADARAMVRQARISRRQLMVGHILLLHPAVRSARRVIKCGDLGDVVYAESDRLGQASGHRNESVLWTLGPHDVSLLVYLLADHVVAAVGTSTGSSSDDSVTCQLRFGLGSHAILRMSSSSPVRVRRTVVVGSERTLVLNEEGTAMRMSIYETDRRTIERQALSGPITWPLVATEVISATQELLQVEVEAFAALVQAGRSVWATGSEGERVTAVLEACAISMAHGGVSVAVPLLGEAPVLAERGAQAVTIDGRQRVVVHD